MSHTQLHREYITSSEMYSLHLTHPKWTHTRSSGQPCYSARGAVGGSVPCSRTPQSWYWRRILPPPTIPAGPEIRTHNLPLTSQTRYPLGHDCLYISAVIFDCHIAYNTVSHVYSFYILGGVKFTYVVSTTRCIYTCPVSSGMRPRPPPEVFWAIGFILQKHEVTRCKQPLYIFFIKMKLSSRLCLTHKRVTQKYRNSKLI